MLFLAVLGFVAFMQIGPPLPQPIPQPAPTPVVPGPSPGGNTITPGGSTQVMSQATFGQYAVAGTDAIMTRTAEGGFEMIRQVGQMPQWLQNRNAGNTVDQEQSRQLNDILTGAMLALIPLCVALAIGSNVLTVVTGKAVSPGLAVGSVLGVAFGALIGFNNRALFGSLVDLAATIFAAIAGADLMMTVNPTLVVARFTAPIVGALLAIVYGIIVLCLTVVWWIQWAWVIVLSAMLGLAVLASFTPYSAPFGRQVIKRWAGSVIDPLLMLTAIKLGQPFIGTLSAAPTAVQQIATLGFLIVAWQSPGFFVGAIGGAVPWLAEAYMVGRLIGMNRLFGGRGGAAAATPGALPPGGGGVAAATEAMPTPGHNNAARWKPVRWLPHPTAPHPRPRLGPA